MRRNFPDYIYVPIEDDILKVKLSGISGKNATYTDRSGAAWILTVKDLDRFTFNAAKQMLVQQTMTIVEHSKRVIERQTAIYQKVAAMKE